MGCVPSVYQSQILILTDLYRTQMWNLCHSIVVVSYLSLPFLRAKLTLLDPVPKRHVLAFMKKSVPHITRLFILSVQVITAQRMYHHSRDYRNFVNFYLVA